MIKVNFDWLREKPIAVCVLIIVALLLICLLALFQNRPIEIGSIKLGSVPSQDSAKKPTDAEQPSHKTDPVAPTVSKAKLTYSKKTGGDNTVVYEETLASNELIVGDTYGISYQDYSNTECVAFIIKGGGQIRFTLTSGVYYKLKFHRFFIDF